MTEWYVDRFVPADSIQQKCFYIEEREQKMKKWIKGSLAILLGVMSISIPFAGIHTAEAKTTEETDKKLNIVTTIFPEYDWTRAILGDRADDVNLTMLLDNGTDLHSFQPAVKDIMKVSSCDLLIYVGGESDQWIEDALESAQNKDMKTINLMEVLGDSIKEEETVEGMQESDHDHDHDHEDEEEKEYDEHVWTSMRNAEVICDAIAATLEEMDPENKEIYQSNAETYKEKLSALDEEYQETVDSAKQKTLIFADRFPFRYLVDDYGLNYYAAFSGCSAESEASFKTVTFLAGKVDELGVKSVLTMEKSDDRIAQTVIENTKAKDQKILQLNSMQSITSEEIADGATYLSVMEDNLGILKKALN